ncbi:MFS transporter [Lysinibacillus sp. NPDC058147]|uniref:MFS transporter n=1 Tax=unclassified Lysinibacillus TaxID=2636778 RepID=UPI0036DCB420
MSKTALESKLSKDIVDCDEKKDSYKALFAIKNYSLLIVGQLVSAIGDGVYALTLIWTMKVLTGSAILMSFVLAAEIIPTIIFGIFAGVLVDRGNQKKYMLIADIFRGLVILLIALLLIGSYLSPWMLIVATIITSSFNAFFSPAKTVAIRKIVPDHLMARAQSLSATIQTIVGLLAPAIAGVLIVYSLSTAFIFNAATFFISLICIALIKQKSLTEKSETKLNIKNFSVDLKTGLKTIISVPILRGMIIYLVLINFMLAPVSILFPMFVKNASELAIVQIAFAIGILIGSIAINFFSKTKKIIPMIVGLTLLLGAFAALAFVDNIVVVTLLVSIVGLGSISASIVLQTLFMIKVPREVLGRSQSTMRVLLESSKPISLLLTGTLLVHFSISNLFLGIAIFGGIVVLLMVLDPAIRKDSN